VDPHRITKSIWIWKYSILYIKQKYLREQSRILEVSVKCKTVLVTRPRMMFEDLT